MSPGDRIQLGLRSATIPLHSRETKAEASGCVSGDYPVLDTMAGRASNSQRDRPVFGRVAGRNQRGFIAWPL